VICLDPEPSPAQLWHQSASVACSDHCWYLSASVSRPLQSSIALFSFPFIRINNPGRSSHFISRLQTQAVHRLAEEEEAEDNENRTWDSAAPHA